MSDNWNWAEKLASWQTRQGGRHEHELEHDDGSGNCVTVGACTRNVCRSFEVAVPVSIRPIGVPLPPSASCGGKAVVTPGHSRCCTPRSFDFTITQVVNVDIPIEFGVEVCYHKPCAEDNGPCSAGGGCKN